MTGIGGDELRKLFGAERPNRPLVRRKNSRELERPEVFLSRIEHRDWNHFLGSQMGQGWDGKCDRQQ
jgi:hypothetical protein